MSTRIAVHNIRVLALRSCPKSILDTFLGPRNCSFVTVQSLADFHPRPADTKTSISPLLLPFATPHGSATFIHTSSFLLDKENNDLPAGLNPLQQAPPPTNTDSGSLNTSGGEEEGEGTMTISKAGPGMALCKARNLKISPQKLNDFCKIIRGLRLDEAIMQCGVSPKKAARLVRMGLRSAKANAVNNHGLDGEKLSVYEAIVGKGTHLKRIKIHGRGRSGKMSRYRSHLTVKLQEKEVPRKMHVKKTMFERDGSIRDQGRMGRRRRGEGEEGEESQVATA
jgi:large subunit ribosomal protein L22